MRAVRSVRLIVGLAVLVTVLSLGASSASAFSLSSSTASTQAGAPTNMAFTYVATGTQAVSRLNVDLPPGMMHDPSVTPACPVATFQADRCPATSRVATAATVINVAGTQLSVPGAVFHVADPSDDSDFPLGIVLRPPLSALGLTGKIFLRDRVSFTNGGGLRHSIAVPRLELIVLGLPLRGRLQRMSLSFTGQNPNGNQLYNSTAAATQPYRATATFSDGSSESRTSPYSTIGSDKLIFVGGFDVDFDAKLGQPQSYAVLLKGSAKAPAGVTHEYHRSGASIDISEIGEWDKNALDAADTCTDAEFITNTCPIRSQLGTFTTGIEGFPGVRRGAIYNSYPRGAKPKAALRFTVADPRPFTLDFVTSADGRSSLEIDGLPQVPLTDLKLNIDAPVFVARQKPASCSAREARAVIFGYSGGQTNTTAKYPAVACPPNVSFADTGDEDADGDGFADDSLKPESFVVPYNVADGGNGVDQESASCSLESPDAAKAIRGKVKVIRDNGNGYTGCAVSEAGGDVTVVFSIASLDGHRTVLKSSYNVDSEEPVLSSIAPEPIESSSTNVALPFEFTDDRIAHPQSVYEIECVLEDESGNRQTTTPGHKYIDTLTLRGGGECMWDTGRKGKFSGAVTLMSNSGQTTILKRTIIVDTDGPTITPTDWRDQDDDGDAMPNDAIRLSAFDVPFSVSDDSGIDPASISCKLINPVAMDKGLRVADLDGDGIGDVCQVTDAPGGPIVVEISAADYRGQLTVLKLAYTVDTDAPVYETTAPDKVVYDLSSFDFEFEFTDDTASHPQSKFKAGAEIEIKLGVQSSSAKIVTDRDSGRSKGFARFENVPDGDHVVTLTIEDSTGHVTVLKVAITVDAEPPVLTLTDTRDQDSDGDGFADDELRPAAFSVEFDATNNGQPLELSSLSCDVTDAAGAQTRAKGTVKGIPTTTPTPVRFACDVTDASGVVVVSITARGRGGHLTVLKSAYTADTEAPVIIGRDRGFFSIPEVGDEFEITDDTLTHPQSRFDGSCALSGDAITEPQLVVARIVTDRDSGRSKGFCSFTDVPDGEHLLSRTVTDAVGNSVTVRGTVVVDSNGPVINSFDDVDGDGSFDKHFLPSNFKSPFRLSDFSGIDPASVSCRVRDYNWRVTVADLDGDGIGDACDVADATPGTFELEISAADVHGHVTVLKLAGEIESPMPQVEILSPTEGQAFSYGGTLNPTFTIVGDGPFTFTCAIDGMVVASPCTSSMPINLTGLSSGPHTLTVTARDSSGRSSTDSVAFLIGSAPPPDVCIAIYPPPEGCPGYVPPGTTICVTVPYPVCYPAGTLPPGGGISLP